MEATTFVEDFILAQTGSPPPQTPDFAMIAKLELPLLTILFQCCLEGDLFLKEASGLL